MYTGYLVCVPVTSTNTEVTIKKIIEHWILKFGIPTCCHHDLGSGFTSKLFKAILKVFGIKDLPGTSFHSQTQGKVESQNRRLNMCFRASLSDKDFRNYDLYAKYIVFALNCLRSSRTGYSANFLVFSRELTMPRDLFINNDNRLETLKTEEDPLTIQQHAYNLYNQVRDITRRVRDNTKRRAMYMSMQYNKHIKGPFFEKGQYCLVLVNVPKHKYSEKWSGPYLITEKINDWNYIIALNGNEKVINISKMKPYKINKYSKLPESQKRNPASTVEAKNPVTNKSTLSTSTNTPRARDDSDSDDGLIIYFPTDPKTGTNGATNGTSDIGNNVTNAADHEITNNDGNRDVTNNVTNDNTGLAVPVALPSGNSGTPEPSVVETPRSPAIESEADDNEAFFDANSSPSRGRLEVSDETPTSSNKSPRNVLLPDIDRHGKKKGVRITTPAQDLSRSTNVSDLRSTSSTGSRSSIRSGLRDLPKKFYGIGTGKKARKK